MAEPIWTPPTSGMVYSNSKIQILLKTYTSQTIVSAKDGSWLNFGVTNVAVEVSALPQEEPGPIKVLEFNCLDELTEASFNRAVKLFKSKVIESMAVEQVCPNKGSIHS
ncbi:hypothetical protein [Vibrio phage vB_VpaP_SJSY21]|nr:hypothetical protein [Vibrio phage vB_VpaP_SJSY21]